jgi:hypothetical protein
LPSAPSSDRSRASRQEAWPTSGTRVFSGADLEAAVAAATEVIGPDVDVRAARSVRQGLRGRTHVEVLVADADVPAPHPAAAAVPAPHPATAALPAAAQPPLPPSERPAYDADPVETTLAALLASADAEEQAFQQRDLPSHAGVVVPFDAPPLPPPGNPTFAAEFAAAFPAALAAVRATEHPDAPRPDVAPKRPAAPMDDFTLRVRDALRRVPEENEALDEDAVELIDPPRPAHPHPALDLLDDPTVELPTARSTAAIPSAASLARPVATPAPRTPEQPLVRRSRPSPGPTAAIGRPAVLRRAGTPGAAWSSSRLRDLGVPDAVLAALPHAEPADDLHWLVALTAAIGATIPGPVVDGTADVTASGTGLRGALALLRLGLTGIAPQTLTIDGRAVPATATELALAVRAGVLR